MKITLQDGVYAAAYSHDCGIDIRVFQTRKSAMDWKIELARTYWDDAFPDGLPEGLSDEDIADQYFDNSTSEYFSINHVRIEP